MQLLSTIQALGFIAITIIFVRELTLTVTVSLRGVLRCNRLHFDAVFLSLVFDLALDFSQRQLLELGSVRVARRHILQSLERDGRTVVFNGFSNNSI